jgi:hypothetical protein
MNTQNRTLEFIAKLPRRRGFAEAFALIGAGLYLLHSWASAHGQASVLDEGLYLYKGYLFASGRYWPFQDYGPLTNHMPLSFLIPGWIQLIFEPGIRTGRYAAILLGLLMLLGIWVTARRLSGKWPAALTIWFVALNPYTVKVYSQFTSQVLVAFLLVWVLAFVVGRDQAEWKIYAGVALAAATAMTRLNMMPLVPILLVYIWWQNGKRTGLISVAISIALLSIGHMIFWPGILKLWANWIPASLTPFLEPWRETATNIPFWDPAISLESRWNSLQIGIQRNLLAFMGVLAAILAWPHRRANRAAFPFKKGAAFLLALFAVLLALHAWASLGQDYCVYCFQVYLAFFSHIGLLLLVVSVFRWLPNHSAKRRVLTYLTLLAATLLSASFQISTLAQSLADTQVLRIKQSRILPGTIQLSELLFNRFGIREQSIVDLAGIVLWSWLIMLGGLMIYLIASYLVPKDLKTARVKGSTFMLAFGGIWLAWLSVGYGNGYRYYDCGPDVIASYEAVGADLRQKIPSDALVYWAGGLSPIPLLYLPEVNIFPAQLNQAYTFRVSGDPKELERFGFWNQTLADEWLEEADVVLLEERMFGEWIMSGTEISDFDEIDHTPQALQCRSDSSIYIYERLP